MFGTNWVKKEDEELLRLVQQGESRALTELYKRYSKKMVSYFHRMLWKDEQKAQDFLQDLFLKIIEKASAIRSDRKFSTWLYSVAYNMCKNEYRKQSFRATAFMNGLHKQETHQPELDVLDFSHRLETILLNCDEDDRNLFVLRFEQEISISEIALIMDCKEGTIKSRLFYLKRKLAEQLHVFNPALN